MLLVHCRYWGGNNGSHLLLPGFMRSERDTKTFALHPRGIKIRASVFCFPPRICPDTLWAVPCVSDCPWRYCPMREKERAAAWCIPRPARITVVSDLGLRTHTHLFVPPCRRRLLDRHALFPPGGCKGKAASELSLLLSLRAWAAAEERMEHDRAAAVGML